MEEKTIGDAVLEYLKQKPRKTAKEIYKDNFENITTLNTVRVEINRLVRSGKIIKDGRWYKEYRYSVPEAVNPDKETIKVLKEGILELNKLMSMTKPDIPQEIDKKKIKEGIEKCHTI